MASIGLGLGLALSAAGSIGGAAIGANAASSAASTQAQASEDAAQLQYQESENALDFQKQQYQQQQANFAPWLGAGENGLTTLQYLMGVGPPPGGAPTTTARPTGGPSMPTGATPQISNGSTNPSGMPRPGAVVQGPNGPMGSNGPVSLGSMMGGGSVGPVPFSGAQPTGGPQLPAGATGMPSTNLGTYGSLMSPYPGGQFTAPTADQALQSPAEQAELKLSQQALQESAAARGNLLTGGTAEAINQNAEDIAATNYQNVYNNAFNAYGQNYNVWQQQQQNLYNRLAALSGVGQSSAQQLGILGQNASNNVSNNLLTTGQLMGQSLQNAGAANASGIIGSANAINGGISGATGSLTSGLLLNQLMNGGSNPNDLSWMLGPGTPGVPGNG